MHSTPFLTNNNVMAIFVFLAFGYVLWMICFGEVSDLDDYLGVVGGTARSAFWFAVIFLIGIAIF